MSANDKCHVAIWRRFEAARSAAEESSIYIYIYIFFFFFVLSYLLILHRRSLITGGLLIGASSG